MSLPSILVYVSPSTDAATFDLAKRASGILKAPTSLLVVTPDSREVIPVAGMGEGMTAAAVDEMIRNAEAGADAARQAAQAAVGTWPDGLEVSTIEHSGRLYDTVATYGRIHGLTMVERSGDAPGEDDALDAALYRTGRPALIAPKNAPASLGSRIAVFWNDSAEAAKAFWAAFPLMRSAEVVRIFACDDGFDADGALDRFQRRLGALGLEIETKTIASPSSGSAGEALQAAAADMDADLIVMGAYTHSRLRELILGGVTRTVLSDLDRPAFLAH